MVDMNTDVNIEDDDKLGNIVTSNRNGNDSENTMTLKIVMASDHM